MKVLSSWLRDVPFDAAPDPATPTTVDARHGRSSRGAHLGGAA